MGEAGLPVSGMPQECFRWGVGSAAGPAPHGPWDGAPGAGQHVLGGGGARRGGPGRAVDLGRLPDRGPGDPPLPRCPRRRGGVTGGRAIGCRGAQGARAVWGRSGCPFVCSRCGGGAGWKRAAPSILVPRAQSWLEGHQVAARSGALPVEVGLSRPSAPTTSSSSSSSASPHGTDRCQQPRPRGPRCGVGRGTSGNGPAGAFPQLSADASTCKACDLWPSLG